MDDGKVAPSAGIEPARNRSKRLMLSVTSRGESGPCYPSPTGFSGLELRGTFVIPSREMARDVGFEPTLNQVRDLSDCPVAESRWGDQRESNPYSKVHNLVCCRYNMTAISGAGSWNPTSVNALQEHRPSTERYRRKWSRGPGSNRRHPFTERRLCR